MANELMRNYAEEVFHLIGRKIVNYAEFFDGEKIRTPHGVRVGAVRFPTAETHPRVLPLPKGRGRGD